MSTTNVSESEYRVKHAIISEHGHNRLRQLHADISNGDKSQHVDVNIHGAHREDQHKSSSKSTAQCSGLHEAVGDLLTLT